MPHPFHCPHCNHESHVVAPPAWAGPLVGVAWASAAAEVFAAAMLGPFILLVVPVLFACGAGFISGAHALAGEPATCGRCGKIALVAAVPAARPEIAPALPRAA